jgi:predicted ATPase
MAHAGTVRELLANHAERTFVGRSNELAVLSTMLEKPIPPVTFIHGTGGIGKSRLLEAFATRARAVNVRVVCRPSRTIRPFR